MRLHLVTFFVPSRELADAAVEAIKASGDWARVIGNVWFVSSNDTTEALRNRIMKSTGGQGRLLVVNATESDWAANNLPPQVTDWLKKA